MITASKELAPSIDLANNEIAVFLSLEQSLDLSTVLIPGNVVVFVEPPSTPDKTSLADYVGPHEVIRYDSVVNIHGSVDYMVIKNPYPEALPPKDRTKPYTEGKIIIAKVSELTKWTYAFQTSMDPTPPGPPSAPWAV